MVKSEVVWPFIFVVLFVCWCFLLAASLLSWDERVLSPDNNFSVSDCSYNGLSQSGRFRFQQLISCAWPFSSSSLKMALCRDLFNAYLYKEFTEYSLTHVLSDTTAKWLCTVSPFRAIFSSSFCLYRESVMVAAAQQLHQVETGNQIPVA